MHNLTMEQQFFLRKSEISLSAAPKGDVVKFAIEILTQAFIKATMYKEMLKQQMELGL